MTYKGVIFDFNGTLFWDTKLHNKAWDIFLDKYQIQIPDDDKFRKLHGKNNSDILKNLFGKDTPQLQIEKYIHEKESLYTQLCIDTNFLELAPGAEDFFEFLKSRNIPFTIATASGQENLDFYFQYLSIPKWFEYDKVVYNDGTIEGKPAADIYLKAMKIINCHPSEVIVFEDAVAGLEAARNAHAGKIIVVDSNDDDYSDWTDCPIIHNFDEVDRQLFE